MTMQSFKSQITTILKKAVDGIALQCSYFIHPFNNSQMWSTYSFSLQYQCSVKVHVTVIKETTVLITKYFFSARKYILKKDTDISQEYYFVLTLRRKRDKSGMITRCHENNKKTNVAITFLGYGYVYIIMIIISRCRILQCNKIDIIF